MSTLMTCLFAREFEFRRWIHSHLALFSSFCIMEEDSNNNKRPLDVVETTATTSPLFKKPCRVTMENDGRQVVSFVDDQLTTTTKPRKQKKIPWTKEVSQTIARRVVLSSSCRILTQLSLRLITPIPIHATRRTMHCESLLEKCRRKKKANQQSGPPFPRKWAFARASSVANVGISICVQVLSREIGRSKKMLSLRNSKVFMATSGV